MKQRKSLSFVKLLLLTLTIAWSEVALAQGGHPKYNQATLLAQAKARGGSSTLQSGHALPRANGLSGNTSVSIRINPLPTTTIVGTQSVCVGNVAQYSAAKAMASYSWSAQGGTILGAGDEQQVSVLWAGAGTLTVTYTDAKGCSNSTTINIAPMGHVYNHVDEQTLCQHAGYTWHGQVIPTDVPGVDTFYHTVHNSGDCDSLYVLYATVIATPEVTLSYSSPSFQDVLVLSPVTLTATPSYYDDYKFVINEITVYQGRNAEVVTQNGVNYGGRDNYARVEVTDATGCRNADSAHFTVKVIMPNAFSPDGDGVNDVFLKGFDLKIFNRYGHVLYRGFDGWNGKYSANDMPTGTYFYEVKLKVDDNKTEVMSGSVRLER